MTISTGQQGSQETFNDAFLSKLLGGAIAGKVNLLNADSDNVYDLQLAINNLLASIQIIQDQIDNALSGYDLTSQIVAIDGELTLPLKRSNIIKVIGDGEAVNLAILPFGATPTGVVDTQIIRLYGTSDTNTVTLKHNDNDYGCILNGDCLLKAGNMIELMYDIGINRFVEQVRN